MISRFLSRRALLPDQFLYSTPQAIGLEAEEVELWSKGGNKLRGWFLRGRKPGVIVFCPGNSGNVSSHLEYVRIAARTGHSVLCFDYEGFGRSEGRATLRSVVPDVEAACEFAAFHTHEPYALFGLSLGAGAALAAAGRAASEAVAIAVEGVSDITGMLVGLLTEGAFGPNRIHWVGGRNGTLLERIRTRFVPGRCSPRFAPAVAWLFAAWYPFPGKSLAALAPRLGARPVLIVHGVEDALLPFETAIDFYDQLRGPKRLWLIPNVAHAQEPALACGADYSAQLEDFFGRAFERRPLDDPAANVSDLQAHTPILGSVTARLGVASSPASPDDGRVVLLSAAGGDVLRQATLRGREEVEMEFPGPLEHLSALRLRHGGEDDVAERYSRGGYRALFREMARAANGRDLTGLDTALERHMALERGYPFDFFAGLYCLRGAQAALGIAPGWQASEPVIARRSLERLVILASACPRPDGISRAEGLAAWAEKRLAEMSVKRGVA